MHLVAEGMDDSVVGRNPRLPPVVDPYLAPRPRLRGPLRLCARGSAIAGVRTERLGIGITRADIQSRLDTLDLVVGHLITTTAGGVRPLDAGVRPAVRPWMVDDVEIIDVRVGVIRPQPDGRGFRVREHL